MKENEGTNTLTKGEEEEKDETFNNTRKEIS